MKQGPAPIGTLYWWIGGTIEDDGVLLEFEIDDFIQCVIWRKQAEVLAQYTQKGSQQQSYAQDGQVMNSQSLPF